MKKLIHKFLTLKAILKYLKDPRQVDSVLKLGNVITDPENKQLFLTELRKNASIDKMISEKIGLHDSLLSQNLSSYPEGSLGHSYHLYLMENNLDPGFYKKLTNQVTNDSDYLQFRLRQTHDLWHVVTDFDTSEEGEAGLIAFYYAQLKTPLAGLITCLAFIHFYRKKRTELPKLFNTVTRGWQLGQSTQALLAVHWEEQLNTPLAELKKDLCLGCR